MGSFERTPAHLQEHRRGATRDDRDAQRRRPPRPLACNRRDHPCVPGRCGGGASSCLLAHYPPDVSSPGTSSDSAGKPVWLPVAAVVVSGLVVNWLSDAISVSPPILILLVAVALVLLVAGERSSRFELPFDGANLELAKLALLAALIGAGVGAIAVQPIFRETYIEGAWGFFYNYELGAAAVLVVLAATSAVRRQEPVQWLIFLAGSVAGMTLSIVYLKPVNDFVSTFVGWLVFSTLATIVVSSGRELGRMLVDFLGFGRR